jgi:membrane protein
VGKRLQGLIVHSKIRQFIDFWAIVGRRFVKDRFTYSSAALTYTTLLAIIPLMTVAFSILSAFPIFGSFKEDIQKFVFSNFIPAAGDVIQKYMQNFLSQTGKLSAVGTIFLVVTAIMTMLTIERALNDVWKISQRRKGIYSLLMYWAILSLAPIFLGLSLAATSYVVTLPIIVGAAHSVGLGFMLAQVVPFVLTVGAFTLLYVIVPNCKVPWRQGLFAAVIAAIVFELVKKAFVLYITNSTTYEVLYGALATIPIFLLWVYLAWVIVLFGALISNVLTTRYYEKRGGYIDGFMHAFLWIGCLWKAQQEGETLSVSQLYRQVPGNYQIYPEHQIEALIKAKLITVAEKNTLVLARDLSNLSLAELYHMLPWKLSKAKTFGHQEKAFTKILKEANADITQTMSSPLGDVYKDLYSK